MAKSSGKHAQHNGTKNGARGKPAKLEAAAGKSKHKKLAIAGSIPIRRRGNEFEVCLVSSRKRKERYVFPKGRAERNEKLKHTAIRETVEEAGLLGELIDYPIIHKSGTHENNNAGTEICFYPMLVETEMKRWPERFMRQRRWVPLTKLKKKKKYKHLRGILKALETARPRQKKKIFKHLRRVSL